MKEYMKYTAEPIRRQRGLAHITTPYKDVMRYAILILPFFSTCFEKEKKIKICSYGGLTTDLCKDHGIKFILRGLRNSEDFNFENSLASMNKEMSNVETIFILSSSNTSHINSSLVRDILLNNGDYSKFIPYQIKF